MPKVEIYTRDFCGYCARAKALLSQKGADFTEYNVGLDNEKRREMNARSNGGNTFPQILIDDQPIGGCDDLFALERAGKLDGMLGLVAKGG